MQVQDHTDLPWTFQDLLLDVVNSWSDCFRSLLPHSVGVDTCEFSASIAVNNSVGVDHGYYLEDILVDHAALAALSRHSLQQMSHKSFDHKARSGFHRMLPPQHPHNFAILHRYLPSRNGDEVDCVLAGSFAEFGDGKDVAVAGFGEEGLHE